MPVVGEASYSGNPADGGVDLVRHLIGDTGYDGAYWLSDAEVEYELTRWTNTQLSPPVVRPYSAASSAVRTIMARVSQRVDVVDGDSQAKLSTQQASFEKLAKTLDDQAQLIDGFAPYVAVPVGLGLTSEDDGPYFRVGMHDSPFLPSNHVHNDDMPVDDVLLGDTFENL